MLDSRSRTLQFRILNKATLAACGFVLLGTFLRVYRLDLMEFKGDEQEALNLGIRLLSDRPWLTNEPWPRHGMLSSNQVANPPLFNWVMAALWSLTKHPVTAAGLIGFVNGITLYPLWRWAARRFDQERALILLAMAAVSPFFVIFSRKLWAQDLLLPGLVCVLWAIERWKDRKPWQTAILFLVATLLVGQLHQSGAIALAVFPLAVAIQFVRTGQRPNGAAIHKPSPAEGFVLAGVISLNAFFWIPYLGYLLEVPTQVFISRPTLETYEPALLLRAVKQVAPLDLFYFFEPDRADFLANPLRRVTYQLAVAFGLPLALYGLWRWARAPLRVPVVGAWWWLVIAVFTIARIPTYPFYVLVLSPLPAALAVGAFDGHFRWSWLERTVLLWRWTYIAALALLTCSIGIWLSERGGSRGDYGVVYSVREAQARALIRTTSAPSEAAFGERAWDERMPLDCRPVPIEVFWILERVYAQRPLSGSFQICDQWAERRDSLVYQWSIRRGTGQLLLVAHQPHAIAAIVRHQNGAVE